MFILTILDAAGNTRTVLPPALARTAGSRHRSLTRNLVEPSPSFELQDRDKIGRIDECFVFVPFSGTENAFIRRLTERFNPSLDWSISPEGKRTPRRFRVEAKAQGFQEIVEPGTGIHAATLPQLPCCGKRNTADWRAITCP
jgi:hypothetical protein